MSNAFSVASDSSSCLKSRRTLHEAVRIKNIEIIVSGRVRVWVSLARYKKHLERTKILEYRPNYASQYGECSSHFMDKYTDRINNMLDVLWNVRIEIPPRGWQTLMGSLANCLVGGYFPAYIIHVSRLRDGGRMFSNAQRKWIGMCGPQEELRSPPRIDTSTIYVGWWLLVIGVG